jgi:hypothetical protein
MSQERHFLRDRFTFGLRGMTATASYFITPVLADDRINQAWDKKLGGKAHQYGASDVTPDAPLCAAWSDSTS